jgi:CRP-like cAMP-binding protein
VNRHCRSHQAATPSQRRKDVGGAASPNEDLGVFPEWLRMRHDFKSIVPGSYPAWLIAAKKKASERTYADKSKIYDYIRSVTTFDELDMEPQQLAEALVYRAIAAGSTVSTPGRDTGTFYVVLSGAVCAEHLPAHTLGSGSTFGAHTQGHLSLREDMVVAVGPTEVLMVNKKLFIDTAMWDAVDFLQRTPLFCHWSKSRLREAAHRFNTRLYQPNEVIVREGDESDGVYFIRKGEVQVAKRVPVVRQNRWPVANSQWETRKSHYSTALTLAKLDEGAYFGEFSYREGKRSATATAVTIVEVLHIAQPEFLKLVTNCRTVLELLDANSSRKKEQSFEDRDKQQIQQFQETGMKRPEIKMVHKDGKLKVIPKSGLQRLRLVSSSSNLF